MSVAANQKNFSFATNFTNSTRNFCSFNCDQIPDFSQLILSGFLFFSNSLSDFYAMEETKTSAAGFPSPTSSTSQPMDAEEHVGQTPSVAAQNFHPEPSEPPGTANLAGNTRPSQNSGRPDYGQMFVNLPDGQNHEPPPVTGSAPGAALAEETPGTPLTLAEFCHNYESTILDTNILLVGYIPLRITHPEFCVAMDTVQRALKVGSMADYYKCPEFAARFREDSTNPWTSDGYFYPDEGQGHASFLLELAEKHLHGYMGTMAHFLRPMAFQVSITAPHARRLLVQPVPDTYHATLLRAPIATWRGIGNDLHQGGALAALAIISAYVNCCSMWACHIVIRIQSSLMISIAYLRVRDKKQSRWRVTSEHRSVHSYR
jgi:hypothetical protein